MVTNRNLQPVEYQVEEQDDGKIRAMHVTGPDGSYVQGAPRPAPVGGGDRDEWSF